MDIACFKEFYAVFGVKVDSRPLSAPGYLLPTMESVDMAVDRGAPEALASFVDVETAPRY